jgi:hypothetical protein
MKSSKLGKSTSKAEILNISQRGVWLLFLEREYFLPFKSFPWFKKASVEQIHNVVVSRSGNLHWPKLDVDLEAESLSSLGNYPLVYKD